MTRLIWDGVRNYSTGIDRGVFYPKNAPAVVWNGLTSVKEVTEDIDELVRYIDGIKTMNRVRRGSFSGTIDAYTYPDEFSWYDGLDSNMISSQHRDSFDLSYRSMTADGYQIHLVYNVLVGPSGRAYAQRDNFTFSWAFTTLETDVPGFAPTSHLVVDVPMAYEEAVSAVEDILYGTDAQNPRLPPPAELIDIFEEHALLQVIDNGDGSFTVIGPDEAIVMLNPTTFEITWPSAIYLSSDTYKISSY